MNCTTPADPVISVEPTTTPLTVLLSTKFWHLLSLYKPNFTPPSLPLYFWVISLSSSSESFLFIWIVATFISWYLNFKTPKRVWPRPVVAVPVHSAPGSNINTIEKVIYPLLSASDTFDIFQLNWYLPLTPL